MAREATLHKVNPYELHGVRYYQLFLAFTDEPDTLREFRLAHDMIYPEPADGDQVNVEMLMSMVTGVSKKPAG